MSYMFKANQVRNIHSLLSKSVEQWTQAEKKASFKKKISAAFIAIGMVGTLFALVSIGRVGTLNVSNILIGTSGALLGSISIGSYYGAEKRKTAASQKKDLATTWMNVSEPIKEKKIAWLLEDTQVDTIRKALDGQYASLFGTQVLPFATRPSR